jgi:16S rRNA G966 N2-methylase RsmD
MDLPRSCWRLVQGQMPQALRQLSAAEAPFDVVLLDPPYQTQEEPTKALQGLVEYAMIAPAGFLAIEHDRRTALPQAVGPLRQIKQHRYGETVLSFYQATT